MTATVRPVDPPMVPMPSDIGVDVLILPIKIEDGDGVYHDSVLTFAKELRAEGASADYQHKAGSRQWLGEKALPLFVVDLMAAVGGHAGWDGLKAVFRSRHGSDQVKARLGRCTETASEKRWEWLEVEGTGEEVAQVIDVVESRQSLEFEWP